MQEKKRWLAFLEFGRLLCQKGSGLEEEEETRPRLGSKKGRAGVWQQLGGYKGFVVVLPSCKHTFRSAPLFGTHARKAFRGKQGVRTLRR